MGIRLVLASTSPRRVELCGLLKYAVELRQPVDYEGGAKLEDPVLAQSLEELLPYCTEETVEQIVCNIACRKALSVSLQDEDVVVIGADTVVVVDGRVLGKPKDEAEAVEMLSLLSGRGHAVLTAVAIARGREIEVELSKTDVVFFELSQSDIANYIASGEPFHKAGGYGIQGAGALLVSGISGDYYNVMGLPIGR